MRIELVVPGVPVQQGSKMPWGGEANPHVKGWRESVARAASEVMEDGPVDGPVQVTVVFVFPRPKAHYRTGRYSDQLREQAPYWHTSAPDLDKLQRAIGDAMTGVVVRDDRQVCAWEVRKLYGVWACAQLVVQTLDGQEEEAA